MNRVETGDISSITEAKDLIDSTLKAGASATQVDDLRTALARMAADDDIRRGALGYLNLRLNEVGSG